MLLYERVAIIGVCTSVVGAKPAVVADHDLRIRRDSGPVGISVPIQTRLSRLPAMSDKWMRHVWGNRHRSIDGVYSRFQSSAWDRADDAYQWRYVVHDIWTFHSHQRCHNRTAWNCCMSDLRSDQCNERLHCCADYRDGFGERSRSGSQWSNESVIRRE
jgi:hypothetical protein